jgi:hypothetical protein
VKGRGHERTEAGNRAAKENQETSAATAAGSATEGDHIEMLILAVRELNCLTVCS